jgi:hypothetical protein
MSKFAKKSKQYIQYISSTNIIHVIIRQLEKTQIDIELYSFKRYFCIEYSQIAENCHYYDKAVRFSD